MNEVQRQVTVFLDFPDPQKGRRAIPAMRERNPQMRKGLRVRYLTMGELMLQQTAAKRTKRVPLSSFENFMVSPPLMDNFQ